MSLLASITAVCLLCLHSLPNVQGGRILLTPAILPSHVSEMASIGEQLAANGHDIYFLLSESHPFVAKYEGGPMKPLIHKGTGPKRFLQHMMENQERMFNIDTMEAFRTLSGPVADTCKELFEDDALNAKFSALKFDLVITDIFPFARCLLVLPYKLGVPHVGLTTAYEWWLLRNPAMPSVTPYNLLNGQYTDKMTFFQRLHNLYRVLDWAWFPNTPVLDNSLVTKYVPDKPAVTIDHLARQTSMWLIDTDFVLEFPRPMMPNEVMVGGLTTKPGKPLAEEYEHFMQQNPKGVIVLTFGSTISKMEPDVLNKFLGAFKQIKYGVLWRNENDLRNLPSRIKTVKWMPQNDVLAHPNTKLFITHCGANGQFEAIYHGVPMISFPLFAEQHHNAARASTHGYSLTLNFEEFTSAELVSAIETIMYNKSFSDNAKRGSEIFRDRPMTAPQRAVSAVEHVLEHGAAHLHSYALDMPWYEFYMVDIFIFWGILIHLLVAVIFIICRYVCNAVRGKSVKIKQN